MLQIFPHEQPLIDAKLGEVARQLELLAAEKSEAQGSSYDWHDNAPLDAIEQEQARVNAERQRFKALRNGQKVAYPDLASPEVALGSLVMTTDKWGDTPLLLTPHREFADMYADAWKRQNPDGEDLSVITPESPIGKIALGQTVGAELTVVNGDRQTTYTVNAINQGWLNQIFGQGF